MNQFMVSKRGSEILVLNIQALAWPLEHESALNLVAWLIAVGELTEAEVHEAVAEALEMEWRDD